MEIRENSQSLVKVAKLLTQKQLERAISQAFLALYRSKLEHVPKKVTCIIFKNYLVIVGEEALSSLEITMIKNGKTQLLSKVHQNIHEIFKSHLKQSIEKIAAREIVDLICKLNIDSGRIIAIATFDKAPAVRVKRRFPNKNR